MKNNSLNDYNDIDVCLYISDTTLSTEEISIVGTTKILSWTDEYTKLVSVGNGRPDVLDLISSRREYNIPTMNRGQVVRFTILNEPKSDQIPTLCLEIIHKGVKLKFNVIQQEIFGIPKLLATIFCLILSAIFFVIVVIFIDKAWLAAVLCLVFGLVALIPGAYVIRAFRWIRSFLGD